MAAASSIQPPSVHSSLAGESALSPEMDSPESRQPEDEEAAAAQPSDSGISLRDLPDLEPEEIERRLAKTRQELSNRRKILIKNLPPDTTNQEVHEILKEYELKYCFVDRNKGTAFVTLLNGDQAQDAIRSLHHSTVRGRLINVALQPTDSLLCLTNLPHTFTAQEFEELVRAYGNIERSFLVYSELTGHSKGYGFVEYMKKDSASRARSELLGRPLGDRSLMVQWMDVNQLSQEENLHSKCLCISRLPLDLCDSEELTQLFSETYKPVFCQLAQDEGSPVRGFGVVEYESAEQAEAMLIEMDRTPVGGQEVRLSLCTPGTSGRSTLAALIAAQGMILSNRKGLLPEPNLAQLLTSMTNPAALQILTRPYHTGKRGGKYGRHTSLPFLRPPLTTALLTLGKAQQSAMLSNGLVLQNLLHMQLAQQQLLHIKDKRISSVSSLLGDPSRLLVQKALSLRPPGLLQLGKGLLGDSPSELGSESAPTSTHSSSVVVSTAGVPYLQACAGAGEQNAASTSAPSTSSSSSTTTCDRQPAPPGTMASSHPQGQGYSLGMSNSGLGLPPPTPTGGVYLSAGQHSTSESSSLANMGGSGQTSLLGDPPKEVRLPSNPYLNLASVMPGVVLQGSLGSKSQVGQPSSGVYGTPAAPVASQSSSSFAHSSTATTTAPYSADTAADYSQYNQAYTQEAMQQWYHHYQAAQAHTYSTAAPQDSAPTDYSKEHTQAPPVTTYGDYSSYMQAVTQYYSQPATASQAYASKEVDVCKPLGVSLHAVSNGAAPPSAVLPAAAVLPAYSTLPLMPGFLGAPHPAAVTPSPVPHTHAAAPDWNTYYYQNQTRGHKREYPQLAVQEVTPSDGAYIGQHSQGLGGQYADYFKRKRL
ncbi:ribonucleoprotein PTB-binding 2 isoform X1 [Takifugu rubripes]|uniref:ribonucleoprotein PTB-binding 2 isoform X1 n=1 Tax=Takifugu rubripes TaxID=31033 RepID=UPI0005D27854|nr:ribonucleoprotein PTB-binding 2 isoform X1 [Takifugu rubripes]|eukprot:XP_011613450.1 PREDICTED: ribonucleoprotein PTB-binding 2 [Takifugu rubripes]